MTMTLISTVTVGAGGAANITFSSIAGTFTDLYLVVSGRSTGSVATGGGVFFIRPNGSSSNASIRRLQGNGSSVSSSTDTNLLGRITPTDWTSTTFGSTSVYIPNYAGSTNKSFSIDANNEQNATEAVQSIIAGLWSNTAAITSLVLVPESGNFAQYSTASLYGILKGSGGATVA